MGGTHPSRLPEARKFGGLALAALCASGCAHRAECTAHGGPPWHELRTDHFEMVTDLPIEVAREEALNLEQLRLTIRLYFGLPAEGADVSRVLYLADPDELHEFRPHQDGFQARMDPPELGFLVSTWFPPKKWIRSRVIPHEVAHRFSADAFPRTAFWLEEGVASYLETIRLEGQTRAVIGGVGNRFGFDGYAFGLDELWGLPPFIGLRGDVQARAYNSAWIWVHYLTNHEPAAWAAFVAALRGGGDPRAHFTAAFPPARWKALGEQVHAYKTDARFRVQPVQLSYDRRVRAERTLAPAEVHGVRALLIDHGSELTPEQRTAAVRAEADQAKALSAGPLPLELELLMAETHAARLEAARRHDGEYLSLVLQADDASNADRPDEAVGHARRAVALRPDGPSGVLQLGEALALLEKFDEAAPLIERAQRLAPWTRRSALAMAMLRAMQGRCAEADAWLDRLVELDPDNLPENLDRTRAAFREGCTQAR